MQNKLYHLVHVIVNKGKASKVLSLSKKHGARFGTIFLCRGTVDHKVLNFLSIFDRDKEMISLLVDDEILNNLIPVLMEKFHFDKPNTGIIFTTRINQIHAFNIEYKVNDEGVKRPMYKLITTLVEKGKGEDVVESANKSGARGATIINARGADSEEVLKLFNMEIEPEKEVVMMIVKEDNYQNIVNSINSDIEINKEGAGIIFVQDIAQAYGLHEDAN